MLLTGVTMTDVYARTPMTTKLAMIGAFAALEGHHCLVSNATERELVYIPN